MEECARCERVATDEIYCKRHYAEYLREWACVCGEINDGDDDSCRKCGKDSN